MMYFKFEQENSDATANFSISFSEPTTLKSMIEQIRDIESERYVTVHLKNIFGRVVCQMKDGAITSACRRFDVLKEKEVESAKASGGWGQMSYYVVLAP